MKRKDIEIMAPAGSYDSLVAAILGGADSVYFGVEQLNMRAASSNNFTIEDLQEIASVCRKNDIRSYITLNVVVYDHEIVQMRRIIDAAVEAGITAVIASDLAVINYASSRGMEIHLSTQLNITNIESLKFYSTWADVVVLARELNLEQVRAIRDAIEAGDIRGPRGGLVRIEMFVHGALCMAVSGKCYLSLHENDKSANRGECYQTCRKSYIATNKETGYEIEIDNQYLMSPKDLCTIGFLDKIIESGVKVLKIEGRARGPEYVREVASCYNEAVTALSENSFSNEQIEKWRERLATVFNRGFWDGYYLGQKLGEWNTKYGSAATKRKLYIGKITNYFTKLNVAEIKLENGDLSKGDRILVTGPTTGAVYYDIDEIRVDLEVTQKASKGELCSIKTTDYLRRSDKVFKWVDASEVRNQ
jgi:U32 family peptidase